MGLDSPGTDARVGLQSKTKTPQLSAPAQRWQCIYHTCALQEVHRRGI